MSELTLDGSTIVDNLVEDVKIKRVSLFDFVSDISERKEYLLDDNNERDFSPYMVNRALSNNIDTIMWANEMNKNWHCSKQMVYDFLFYSVTKKKRYGKWAKASTEHNEQVELLMNHYDVNRRVAISYLALLTEQELSDIKLRHETGGKKNVQGR